MKNWMSLQTEMGNFQHRATIISFALKMSFSAVILSSLIMLIVLPPLSFFDLLPLSLAHSLSLGIVFAWIVGGAACGLLSLIAGFALHQLTVSRAEFEKLSRTDMLSGLLNRRAFTAALADADGDASLVIFDVDRFKAINDTYGHAVGDAVLAEFARRLQAELRAGDLAARMGGDEFAILVENVASLDALEAIAAKLVAAFERDIVVDPLSLTVGTSIGIALSRGDVDGDALLREADAGLYEAKQAGRNTYRVGARPHAPDAPAAPIPFRSGRRPA